MNNLNKLNFWNEQQKETPEAVELFCNWIDKYKKQNAWDIIFNIGICNYKVADIMEQKHSPKFHDLPLAMQLGILQQFAITEPTELLISYVELFVPCNDFQDQKTMAKLYFQTLQSKVNRNALKQI